MFLLSVEFQALAAVPADDWLIVVGHHPIDELDVADFTTVLQKHGFDLYVNGHAHSLTQYTIDKAGAYVTSGAGSLAATSAASRQVTFEKTLGLTHTGAHAHSRRGVGFMC